MPEIKFRQRDIVRAQISPSSQTLAVILSCNEANAVRSVATVCEIREDPKREYSGLPTVVDIPESLIGYGHNWIAIASPYTIPKGCLISKEGSISPQIYEYLEEAVKRIFGWAEWPH